MIEGSLWDALCDQRMFCSGCCVFEKNAKWRLQAGLACDSDNDVGKRAGRDHQTGITIGQPQQLKQR